ncbi:uncharacterized protein LOC122507309 [Leptopilina heterotoma]|uniref:uncharacterized protein LOC122507309 n=1 Tax=Leptopilina heterotoma TaxID=63436 RepID=UPI001CA80571|nr:uncharacterized protein LOC122507309 [Leptopilina heterotoma]
MYSDCGTNFQGASKELRVAFESAVESVEFKNIIAKDRIQWRFNPPAAPHFGGLWEASVKSMKAKLVKLFGSSTPTYEELSTAIYQISAILNSRPLTPITEHIDDLNVLTPAHFLIGGSFSAIPQPSLCHLKQNQLSRWQHMLQCTESFWNQWLNDYLRTLQQRFKWQDVEDSIIVGQMVLLRRPNVPPTKWVLGRIIEIKRSSDNLDRVVKVKTSTSEYLRPITEVVVLPFQANSNESDM